MSQAMALVREGHFEQVRNVVVASGGSMDDLHRPDSKGNTLLHFAVTGDSLELVRALLELGLSPMERNKVSQGATPLSLAISCHAPVEFIKILLDFTPASVRSCAFPLLQTALDRGASVEIVQLLASECTREELNKFDRLGRNLIYMAIERTANPSVLNCLLEMGVDPNTASTMGFTPLYLAVFYNARTATVSTLLRYGANPYKQVWRLSSVELAVCHGKTQLVQYMQMTTLMMILCSVRTVPRLGCKSVLRLVPKDVIRLLLSRLFLPP